jgi:hypothetical protein
MFGTIGAMPRLLVSCSAYRRHFGVWPTQARIAPILLRSFASELPEERWTQLVARMELRTAPLLEPGGVSVGGVGVIVYDRDIQNEDWAGTAEVEEWLASALVDDRLI